MTKAEMVQELVQKLEMSNVVFPSWACIQSNALYWEKHPDGYVFDEVRDENLVTHYTVESQLACFNKIALMRLLDFPVPTGIYFSKLWQLWGRNGLLAMPATMLRLNGNTHLQLRHNVFVSYRRTGFVASHDLSGKHSACIPCNSMHKSVPYLALLSKKNLTCMAIYWSYLAQVLAPWEEFPYLLRYNPTLLGNFLITMERENPEGYPRPVKGKISAYALPQYVRCLPVDEEKLVHQISLIDSGEFGRLYLGSDRVSLCVHQVDGDHLYSFDFPEWITENTDWDWDAFYSHWDDDVDLTLADYNRFMWYRLSVLLLALAGVSYSPDKFYTQQSRSLKFRPTDPNLPTASDVQDLELFISKS